MLVNLDAMENHERQVAIELQELAALINGDTPFVRCLEAFFATHQDIEGLIEQALNNIHLARGD